MIIFLIFLAFWLGLSISRSYIVLVIVAIVFLLFVYKRFSIKLSCISLFALLSGFGLSFLQISHDTNSFHGIVFQAKENYILLNSGGERLYVYAKGNSYDIGDILTIEGNKEDFDFTKLESSFDFEEYLNKKGVFHAIKAKSIKVDFRNFIRLKSRREKLLKMFDKEQRSIVGSILFSEGEESELTSTLRELHLARFLAASGIFVSTFYFVLTKLFFFIKKDKYAELVAILLLILYSVFTFPRFSVTKVMLLLIVKWINKYPLKEKFSYLNILGGVGIFCLLMNHYLANQDSFILGFLIPIISYLTRYIGQRKKIIRKLYRYLIIYLFFLPFEINYYNKVVVLSLPLQIISLPLFLAIGVVSLLCFFYVPIYKIDSFLIFILEKYSLLIKPLSFGPYFPNMNEWLMLAYYVLYFFFLYYASHDFVPLTRFFLVGQVVVLILLALPIENRITKEVNFINVGQGDCTLIRDHNKVALIDTGGLTYMDIANDVLVPYLKKKRIYKIDMVFITHYDYDHYGALEELQKTYKVNQVYDYSSSFPVKMGDITFNNYNYYGEGRTEENDKSLVLGFNILNKDFLVMGDAPTYVEKEIIKNESSVPCDILRVGHHGSNTSTCEEWIKYVTPKEAVISVGKNNRFGHPNKEVINVLNKYKIKIRRTDIEGTIVYRQFML